MSPERQQKVRSICAKVFEVPENERLSYLLKTCAGDADLLAEVMRVIEGSAADAQSRGEQTRKIGRYLLCEQLGSGSMGVVYAADDPQIGRRVALKTIAISRLAGCDAEFLRDRLLREAKSAGCLSHPAIVTIYDVSTDNGLPYIVMEMIDGKSLDKYLAAGIRFTVPQVISILRQVA